MPGVEGEWAVTVVDWTGVSVCGDEKVLETDDGGGGCAAINVLNTWTLKSD